MQVVKINNRHGLAMLNKTMFAIFLVIFVFFMFFTVIKLRVEAKEEKAHFDQYDYVNKFFLTFLSNPNCLSVGSDINKEKHTAIQGVLDNKKLNKYDKDNEDMWCVENFEFLYSITILDTVNQKSWLIGLLNQNPFWTERSIGLSLPGLVRYEDGTAHLAHMSINAYFGEIPKFIGAIKKTCLLKSKDTYHVNLNHNIKYISDNNSFHIDTDQFFPYFSCGVNDFEIKKGQHLIYISADNNNVNILT